MNTLFRFFSDVAFKVGPDTSYKYIVVNIHYLKVVENDMSGLAIQVEREPRRYQAGIMLLVSGYIALPPSTKRNFFNLTLNYVQIINKI